MRDIWVISDHHFSHDNILNFKTKDGVKVRDFKDVEEMNSVMIERHNETVKPHDIVYFLGDVGFNRESLDIILPKLHGRKRIILGNHDLFKPSFYEKHFQKVMVSWRALRGDVIFSHHPLLIGDTGDRIKAVVHGHIHRSHIMDGDKLDYRYFNTCVEVMDYHPIHVEEIFAYFILHDIIPETYKRKNHD